MEDTHERLDRHCHMFRKNVIHFAKGDVSGGGSSSEELTFQRGNSISSQLQQNEDLFKEMRKDIEEQKEALEKEVKGVEAKEEGQEEEEVKE